MTASAALEEIILEFRSRMETEGTRSREQASLLVPSGLAREAAESAIRSLGDDRLFVSTTFGPDLQRRIVSILGSSSGAEAAELESFASDIPSYEDPLLGISLASARRLMSRLDAVLETIRSLPEGSTALVRYAPESAQQMQPTQAVGTGTAAAPRSNGFGFAKWLAIAAGAYAGVHFLSRGTSVGKWFPLPFVSGESHAKENKDEEIE